jgi:hypothetical protein
MLTFVLGCLTKAFITLFIAWYVSINWSVLCNWTGGIFVFSDIYDELHDSYW